MISKEVLLVWFIVLFLLLPCDSIIFTIILIFGILFIIARLLDAFF